MDPKIHKTTCTIMVPKIHKTTSTITVPKTNLQSVILK